MKRLALAALAVLTVGAAPRPQDVPHCHFMGPLIVFFEKGSAELSARGHEVLDFTDQLLTADICWRGAKILIVGHGDVAEPEMVSEARAKASRDYLLTKGIAPSRMSTEARGARQLRMVDPAHRENRRVEIWMAPT